MYGEQRCRQAKVEELEKFLEFDVYEEVSDEGQHKLATNWVLTDKIKDGKAVVKARLTVRGDQEEVDDIRKDSPTVRKGNVKLVLTVAAFMKWKLKSSDIKSAFLQALPLERDVFVIPPKERCIPRIIWKLKKPCYGLVDASRGFHLSLSGKLEQLGCENNNLDPAMFLLFPHNTKKLQEKKEPQGIAVSHVDDVLHCGNTIFEKKVMGPLKQAFKFGSEEEEEFRYIGMNVIQQKDGIQIDFKHYIEAVEIPEIDEFEVCDKGLLDDEGQTVFRSIVAKISTIGYRCRPDAVFETKVLSSE